VNIKMTQINQVNEILKGLNGNPDIIASLVILKSGMLVAGNPPEGVHSETFIAMASILITAAESATSDFKGKFENVFVELDRSRIIIGSVGTKGALVVIVNNKENNGHLNAEIEKAALSLHSAL
jgi:predicted regulator of Ras-like GTPase activity (Roadblock/LC7/MglB family)